MKERLTTYQIMENLVESLASTYSKSETRHKGKIQFYLNHNNKDIICYIEGDGEELKLHEGETGNPNVSLKSSFYHWLDLVAKRLNPILGVITGKLKFTGDASFFSKLISRDEGDFDVTPYNDPVTDFERAPHKYWTVPKKVLVLNGSPRGENGYTDFYLNPLLAGMSKARAEIENIYLSKKKINSCTGCWHCWLSGSGECVFKTKDDFAKINEKVKESDLIIYAFPLYVDGVPGILKNLFDRSTQNAHPYMVDGIKKIRHPRRNIRQQSSVIFSICGFIEKINFAPVREHFRAMAINRHIPIVGEIFRSGAIYLYNHPFYFQALTEVLQALEKGGEQIILSGKINKKTLKQIEQRVGKVKDFQKQSNQFWNNNIVNGEKTY